MPERSRAATIVGSMLQPKPPPSGGGNAPHLRTGDFAVFEHSASNSRQTSAGDAAATPPEGSPEKHLQGRFKAPAFHFCADCP